MQLVKPDRHLGFAPGLQLHSVTAESFVVKSHVLSEREDLLEPHPLREWTLDAEPLVNHFSLRNKQNNNTFLSFKLSSVLEFWGTHLHICWIKYVWLIRIEMYYNTSSLSLMFELINCWTKSYSSFKVTAKTFCFWYFYWFYYCILLFYLSLYSTLGLYWVC